MGFNQHDPGHCDCDECRYWRWEMTLRVESITTHPIRESGEASFARAEDNYKSAIKRFVDRETAGEIKAPRGPLTEDNGWKREIYGDMEFVQWGGGPVA